MLNEYFGEQNTESSCFACSFSIDKFFFSFNGFSLLMMSWRNWIEGEILFSCQKGWARERFPYSLGAEGEFCEIFLSISILVTNQSNKQGAVALERSEKVQA